eukprot:scaffold28544_cov126-Skeletonema_dohrnii-CCMP3373.AAC.3
MMTQVRLRESHFFSDAFWLLIFALAKCKVQSATQPSSSKANTTMTIAAETRIIYWCIVLHLSLLLQIIGIASFQFGRNNPAFLPNAQGRTHDVALSPLLAELSSTITAADEQQQQQQEQHHRHAIFQHTNAVSKSFPIPLTDIWHKFVTPTSREEESNRNNNNSSPSFWEQLLSSAQNKVKNNEHQNQLVNDVTVQFDDATTGAQELVKQCQLFPQRSDDTTDGKESTMLPENTMMEREITKHLADVLSCFQSVAGNGNNNIKCQARIVSSIGKNGIKCPRWHADHVPVRLVMSIIGPGCEYIPHEVEIMGSSSNMRLVDRNALNTLDEDDTRIANDIIVPPNLNTEKKTVTSAKEGDAVLLMGRAWEDSSEGDFTDAKILAAVHRSPLLSSGQERILLTVDLVPPL